MLLETYATKTLQSFFALTISLLFNHIVAIFIKTTTKFVFNFLYYVHVFVFDILKNLIHVFFFA